jgi:septal ring factor EnvC (AmiA/AmiB activator)
MGPFSRHWMLALLMGFVLGAAFAEDAVKDVSKQKELENVRARIAVVQDTLAQQTKAAFNLEHDLEYKDPEAIKLREEAKRIEQELIAAQANLKARTSVMPEMQELEKKRKQSYKELQDLRELERLLLSQLAAESNPTPGTNQP